MQSKMAATFLQYKEKYYCKLTLRQPEFIAWSFQIAGKHNVWLIPMDASVNPNKPAFILICQAKPTKLQQGNWNCYDIIWYEVCYSVFKNIIQYLGLF